MTSYRAEPCEDELDALARQLGAHATPPLLLLLEGDLGAGKTRFTRAFVGGIEPDAEDWVSSPTWALCNEYPAAVPIRHLDLYRVDGEDDLESIGFRDLLEDAVVLVEWASRVPGLASIADVLVELEHLPDRSRRGLTLTLRSAAAQAALGEVASQLFGGGGA